MIKKVNYIDTPFAEKENTKSVKFSKDIRDVIENKIEYAELVEMPYSDTTANQDLSYRARKICRKYCLEKYGLNPETTDFFNFAKRTKEDGIHWYVYFNMTDFEKMIDKCLKNS